MARFRTLVLGDTGPREAKLLPSPAKLAVFDIDRREFLIAFVCVLVISTIAQLVLLRAGIYATSQDESARALVAHDLRWDNVFAPSWWPPLTKVVMGLPLRLYDDLFVTPRIEMGLIGLVCLGALAFLTYRLFNNRLAAVLAAALGIVLPQRWILSVVPLSDILGYTLVLVAAGFVAGWLKGGRRADMIGASIVLMLVSAVRVECWFIAAAWGLCLAYSCFFERRLSFGLLVLNGIIVSTFPLFWLAHNYIQLGSLDSFTIVSRQFIDLYGRDVVIALRNNVLYRLLREIVLNPALTLAALVMAWGILSDRLIRVWAAVFFLPAAVEAAGMMLSFSVPIGSGLRSDGVWTLLLLPFAGFAIVLLVRRLADAPVLRIALALGFLYALAIPLVLETRSYLRIYRDTGVMLSKGEVSLGRHLRDRFRHDPALVLLDATDGLSYLNVMVTANAPERFVLNVDADPLETALYAGAELDNLTRYDKATIEKYRKDKFWSGDRLDSAKLDARGIGYVLARRPDYVAALDADHAALARVESFGDWVLFERRPGDGQ